MIAPAVFPSAIGCGCDGKNYNDVDVAIVLDHLILAAADEGLGTCWVGAFDCAAAKRVLGLPLGVEPVAFTPLGYADDQPSPKRRKPLAELVKYERLVVRAPHAGLAWLQPGQTSPRQSAALLMPLRDERSGSLVSYRRWLDLRPVGLIAIGLALVGATAIAAGTWKSVRGKPPLRKIRVTGSAKKRIVSDVIEWNAVVGAHAADRTAA